MMGKYDKYRLLNPEELIRLRQRVEDYLKKHRWKYEVFQDGYYELSLASRYNFVVSFQVNETYMFAVSVLPLYVRYGQANHVIRFIHLVNGELLCGHFSLAKASGEIRYKYGVNYAAEEISDRFIGNIINRAFADTDMCLKAFDSVVNTKISPFKALELIEWAE